LLGSVPRWREQLLEHHRVGRCPVGDDLHRRYLRRADRPLEEAERLSRPTMGRPPRR
jgi:hypothetical protein